MTTEAPDLTPCYVGTKPECGCHIAVIVDRPDDGPDRKKIVAREVTSWLRQGLTIDRMPVEEARKLIAFCPHKAEKKAAKR